MMQKLNPTKIKRDVNWLVIILVLSRILSVPISAKGAGTSFIVNTIQDENDGSCIDKDCSLRDAIQLAAEGDVIQIDISGILVIQNTLEIAKDLTITGPGLDAFTVRGSTQTVFSIKNANVTLSGFTISNGRGSKGGGIFVDSGSRLLLREIHLASNVATTNGGALYLANNAHARLEKAQVNNNQAEQKGGAIYLENGSSLEIGKSTISRNLVTSLDGQGGGLFITGSSVSVTGTIFSQNTAAALMGEGGAWYQTGSTSNIENSLFVANVAGSKGAAIRLQGASAQVSFTTISGNSSASILALSDSAGLDFNNSILWDNVIATNGQAIDQSSGAKFQHSNSIVGDGRRDGDSENDPLFVRPANLGFDDTWGTYDDDLGDFHLRPLSPAIDAAAANCPTVDLSSLKRPIDGNGDKKDACDLGAYEFSDFAPYELTFRPASSDDQGTGGSIVGTFATTDFDEGDEFTYQLESGQGSFDNKAFVIKKDQLIATPALYTLGKSRFTIRVRVVDWAQQGLEKTFTVNMRTIGNVSGGNSAGSSALLSDLANANLPSSGFTPLRMSAVPQQPDKLRYQDYASLELEIPALNLSAPILGVPFAENQWDVSWLTNQVGYLQGTAFPGRVGNSLLSAHVFSANGKPGPFYRLSDLTWGDKIILHAWGQRYTYQVQDQFKLAPNDHSLLRNEEKPWLTLITCSDYDPQKDAYRWRIAVRAILIDVSASQ